MSVAFPPRQSICISYPQYAGELSTMLKKRQRAGSSNRLSSAGLVPDPTGCTGDDANTSISTPVPGGFNDIATADVILSLQLDPEAPPPPFFVESESLTSSPLPDPPHFLDLSLHSSALRHSRYFAALLSDRWAHSERESKPLQLCLKVPLSPASRHRPFDAHVSVLKLLYTKDFSSHVFTVTGALEILHVALELLFDDCVCACVRFLEAVPWTEDEERIILNVIQFLPQPESTDLLSRVLPSKEGGNSSEEMLHDLVLSAIQSHPSMASVKAFVARLLREFPGRDSVRRVLDKAFATNLENFKGLLADYASPDFRTASDNDETEAIQRLNLHAALVSTRKLLWLIERMIELRVAENAVKEWSEQTALAVDLQKAFKDDAWRNIAPGLPAYVMRCTSRLANAISAGSILATREVRMKLVKDWLPVLNVCRDVISPLHSGHKELHQEVEETFLKIISTLPLSDSQELLQQCLCFSTRNADSPHLISAFNTWFRRANRNLGEDNPS